MPARRRSVLGRLAEAARSGKPLFRIAAPPALARFLIAAGARPAPDADTMTVSYADPARGQDVAAASVEVPADAPASELSSLPYLIRDLRRLAAPDRVAAYRDPFAELDAYRSYLGEHRRRLTEPAAHLALLWDSAQELAEGSQTRRSQRINFTSAGGWVISFEAPSDDPGLLLGAGHAGPRDSPISFHLRRTIQSLQEIAGSPLPDWEKLLRTREIIEEFGVTLSSLGGWSPRR